MKKWSLLLITLFLSVYSIVLNAQTNLLNIETAPPDSIVVCGDSAFFSVEITNTHNQPLTNLVYNPKMIPGMIYIPGSVVGMTEQNIASPNEPLFELNTLNPNQTIVLTYYAKAECSIIDQIINLGGNASSGGIATNETRIDYLNNGVSEFSLELNGSNSYNILYADIFISTITNQVEQTIPGATYTRNISVQNGGLGKVESLTLLIDFETGVAVSGTNIGSFNLSGQLATVTLGPAEFAMFGNGDGYFELDEVLTLVDTITMLTCIGGETKYTAFWGCNPLDTCQQDNAYANTILIGGQPVIESDIIINEPTFFGCADTGVIVVEYNNTGIESSVGGANYYNVVMRYESNQEIMNYVGVDLNGVDLFAANVPTNTIVFNGGGNLRERKELLFDNFFTTDPDGVGGLDDLDNDGYYDDLASGETLLATYHYLLESPLAFSNCPVDFYYQFFRESILGYNNCGTAVWGRNFRNAAIQGNPNAASLVTGPPDIFPNDTITVTFENSFIFDESGRFKSQFPSSFISVLKCDSSQVKTYLTLDPSFQIVPGSVLVNGVPTTFTVNGSQVTIFGGQVVGREATNIFSLDLTTDCSIPLTVGAILEWRSAFSCDCGDEINLGCQSQFISRSCPGPPCFGTSSFEVNRTTLGWTDATQTTLVSPSTLGLALNRAYECDTVQAYSEGYAAIGTGLSTNNAHVKVWYRAPAFDQSFNYARGEWTIYDASTGTTYKVPTALPGFTTNGAPASTHQMEFDASNAIASTVGILEDGDSLNIELYLAVNKTDDFPLGAYQFPRFRALHGYVDTNGDTVVCTSLGAEFTILKTKTIVENQIGNTNLGRFAPCGEHKFKFGSQVIGGLGILDDFPNEFRPVNVWDDTLCYTLPKGMYYVPSSIRFNNGPASTVNPNFDPITGKLTFIGSDLYANGWPLLDRIDDRVRVIEFLVSRDCDIVIGDNVIPSEYGYTNYASAPTPACYEYDSVNTNWEVTVSTPKIEMDASLTVIEGFESDLEWNIRICNNGNTQSDNNWIYINDTSGNLTVIDIVDLSNGAISLPFSQIGNFIYVNTGMLVESSCIDLSITTINSDCTPGKLNTLEVFSGWSCSPDLIYNPMACHTDTIPLQYISRRANLQTRVTFPPSNTIDICTPFDIKILLVSSLEANMDDIVHFMELPAGLSIEPGATYEYPLGTTPQPLPAAVDQFGVNTPGWDLTSIIPGLANNFVGTRDTLRNKLRLNYSLAASCAFDPYNLISVNSRGNTNCNELVDLNARKKIFINGFAALDTTEVDLSLVNNSSNCVNQVAAIVNVQNQSSGNLNPLNKLEVTLPAGMTYVLGSYLPNPIVQPQGGGVDLLIFDYPNPLASGATASFNFDLELDQTLTCGPYSIIATSIIRDTAFCATLGQSCNIGATTGIDTAEIAVQTTIDPSFTTSVIEPCLGDSFTLASIATCGTHFWDFGDGNTSTAVNPTHTYNGVVAGLYTITHIITSPCSADTTMTTINVLNQCCQLNINLTTTAINCAGSCDGTATAVVSNGIAPYTYLWSNGSTDSTLSNLCAGTYGVTVTDANNCSITGTTILTNPIAFQASFVSIHATCGGTCDGTTSIIATGGTAPYTYAWSNGGTGSTLSNLCSGTYITTITDANGCEVILTTIITEPTPLLINITTTAINCAGSCDGTATAVVSNGIVPYTYLWSNGSISSTLTNLCAGTYTVTATDLNGCSTTGTVSLTNPTSFQASVTSTNATCAGTCDGTASIITTGGTAPYTYAWSNGGTNSTLSNLCSGTYTVTTTDANGCEVILTSVITEPTPLLVNLTSTIINCGGSCDGTATALVSNGIAPYTYLWSNGSTDSTLSNLCAGTYGVTATDANGCSATGTVSLTNPTSFQASVTSTNATCAGTCDGTASIITTGGTAPYTYAWSNGGTNSTLSNLCSGTYTVTTTDANGCEVILTSVITEPTPLLVNITTTDVSCTTVDSTTCIVTAWRNNNHAIELPNFPNTGDSKFIFENNSGRLHEYPNGTARITGTIVNRSDVNKRWTVDVHFTNGMDWTSWSALGRDYKDESGLVGQNYTDWTYYIMDATKSNTLTGLGDYNGMVLNLTHKPASYRYGLQVGLTANSKDSDYGFSCWFNYTEANSNLTGHGDFNCDLSCPDTASCDGTAQVSTSGGTAPYTYNWSNGSSSDSLTGLCADTFSVTITDANGCSTDTTIIINTTICICSVTALSTSASCPGLCDGTASVTATGLAPYTYQWNNGSTTATLNNLCAGTYTVTITDATGCTSIATVVVTEPAPLLVNITTTDVSCTTVDSTTCIVTAWRNNNHAIELPNFPNTGDSKFIFENNSGRLHEYPNGTARITGTIVNRSDVNKRWTVDVHFTNGMDWTSWSALGRDYKDESGLVGQNYTDWTYYIMDATKSNTLTGLGDYNGMVLNLTHKPASYRYGLQVGLTANSKDSDYGFSCWFNYTEANSNLTGHGDFNCDLSCPDTASCDGTAQVSTSGGTAPYTYNWSNGSSSDSLTGLCADTFSVTITDANGCSTDTTIIINTTICCTAFTSSTNVSCPGFCDGTASVTATGLAPYTYQWSNGSTTATLNNLCAGTYTVTITDANGCTSIATVVVTSPAPLLINVTTTNVSCTSADSTTCIATDWRNNKYVIRLPNLPNTPDSRFAFENNSGRLYEYPNGTARVTGIIVNRSDVTKRWAVDMHFTNGMDWANWSALGRRYKGRANVVGQNYTDWTYYIMDAAQSNTLTGLGSYSGMVLDLTHKPVNYRYGLQVGIAANNKDADYGFSCMFNYADAASNCSGRGNCYSDLNCTNVASCDGTAQVNTSGGTAPYTYNWSNGSSSNSLTGLCANTYSVTITDANGCCTDTTITIDTTTCCSAIALSTNTSCSDICDGTASVTGTGVAPYTYQWSNGSTSATLNNLCAGTYTVTLTDAEGCTSIATAVVTSPAPIVVSVDTLIDESCTGNDGAVVLNVTGGTAPYQMDLANFNSATTYSNSTGNFTGLNAGQYILNVVDTNGCTVICATTFRLDGCVPCPPLTRSSNVIPSTLKVASTVSAILIDYQTSEKVVGISILDATGKSLLNKEHLSGTAQLEIPRNNWEGNTYWIILRGEHNQLLQTKKLILSE